MPNRCMIPLTHVDPMQVTTCKNFICTHLDVLVATVFCTAEV